MKRRETNYHKPTAFSLYCDLIRHFPDNKSPVYVHRCGRNDVVQLNISRIPTFCSNYVTTYVEYTIMDSYMYASREYTSDCDQSYNVRQLFTVASSKLIPIRHTLPISVCEIVDEINFLNNMFDFSLDSIMALVLPETLVSAIRSDPVKYAISPEGSYQEYLKPFICDYAKSLL